MDEETLKAPRYKVQKVVTKFGFHSKPQSC